MLARRPNELDRPNDLESVPFFMNEHSGSVSSLNGFLCRDGSQPSGRLLGPARAKQLLIKGDHPLSLVEQDKKISGFLDRFIGHQDRSEATTCGKATEPPDKS